MVLFLAAAFTQLDVESVLARLTSTKANGSNSISTSPCFVPFNDSVTAPNNFTPDSMTIPKGCTIKWTNTTTKDHTTTSDTGIWDIPLPPSGTYTRTFNTAGTFAYHCEVHGNSMRGEIIVSP
jgi:plastocyanin